jgi:cytoskeletal protein CcmA (bactofilin family)
MAMFDKQKSNKPETSLGRETAAPKPAQSKPAPAPAGSGKVAMIGDGISITGDVSANSDLKIEGRIEGRAVASSHDVEVAASGVVLASITAKEVSVAGAVSGDINGSEKVLISRSGRVQGNITAPRVQLEDGALFRGSIEMNPAESASDKKPATHGKDSKADNDQAKTENAQPAKPAASAETRKEPNLTLKSG